jgi:PadR family transcriptional regulator PadR
MGIDRGLFPGALEMMILQTLRRSTLHAYALAKSIKRNSDDLLQVEEGSLYPALQRMLKAKLVTFEWRVSPNNQKIKVYRITAAGRKKLQSNISSFERMLDAITRVMKRVES